MAPKEKDYLPKMMLGFKKRKIPQLEYELEGLLKLMLAEKVTKYLEIGLRHATTFHWLAERLPRECLMMGIDRPGGEWGDQNRVLAIEKIQEAAAEVQKRHSHTYIFIGDSKSDLAKSRAQNYGPFDLVFIDGDHSYEGVKADWENYSPMARIVAFHDIDSPNAAWKDETEKARFGVHKLWSELIPNYKHRSIVDPNMPGLGIGVIWTGNDFGDSKKG